MAKISPLMIAPPAIFAAFVILAGVGMFRPDKDNLPSTFVGRSAPPVVLGELPDKPTFSDETLKDGNVKMVNFWASWCAPCRVEHPNLTALAEEGVPLYGINYKDDPNAALKFLDELGDPYTGLGTDRTGRDTATNWGVYGIPETFVIDGEGTILLRFPGPVTQRVIEQKIRPALEAAERN